MWQMAGGKWLMAGGYRLREALKTTKAKQIALPFTPLPLYRYPLPPCR
jgi:hypothetical protein